MDGFFQRYLNVGEKRLIKIDDSIPFEEAALTEPLACCVHSVYKGDIHFADYVVVIGAGIMGLLHVQLAKMRGAVVIVSEVDPVRREKALSLGADYTVNPLEQDPEQFVKEVTGGLGANVVFNTTAVSASWLQGINMLARYGKIIAYSSQHPDNPIPIRMGMVHNTEIEIIGTVSPNESDFYTASRLICTGLIDMKPVINHIIPIDEAAGAFDLAVTPGTYRVVIKM
jgi:L-iditol 2-dehydrogenase